MAYQRGDVLLLPFPFSDLSAAKTRPAIVVSGDEYHKSRPDIIVAFVSSQIANATPPTDYVLRDWQQAGLLKPSFVRPKLATIAPALVVHRVGTLLPYDLYEVDRCFRSALSLTASALEDVVAEVDLTVQSVDIVQQVAEKAITALVMRRATDSSIDLAALRALFDE